MMMNQATSRHLCKQMSEAYIGRVTYDDMRHRIEKSCMTIVLVTLMLRRSVIEVKYDQT